MSIISFTEDKEVTRPPRLSLPATARHERAGESDPPANACTGGQVYSLLIMTPFPS